MYATLKRLLSKALVPAVLLVSLSACEHNPETLAVLAAIAGGGAQGMAQGTATHYQPQYYQAPQYQRPLPVVTNCQRQRNGNMVCTTQ